MAEIPGMIRPSVQSLPQIGDRMTFLYFEHCKLSRADSAITVTDENGIIHVPAAAISVLMLGPGTDVTHRAMELIGDAGVSVIWVGEHGVRYYTGGCALTGSSRLLVKQAGEDVAHLTLQQLRGREGSRMRSVYRHWSKETGVPWHGRDYDPEDFSSGDPVNQALSAGNACLYGLAHAVICALGCSPGLGFVHIGHSLSFVYDIADLYKAEITIPIAFRLAAESPEDIPSQTRRSVRNALAESHILERMVKDIKYLLSDESDFGEEDCKPLYLWDDRSGSAEYGKSYRED